MGIEVLFLIGVAVFMPVIFMGFVVVWWSAAKDRNALGREWRSWAKARKADWLPPSGEWPNHRSPLLQWSDAHAAYVIETFDLPRARTRITARLTTAAHGAFNVGVSGDLAHERPAGIAARVFSTDARRAMLGFGTALSLSYVDGAVQFEWRDAETNPARLDEARAVVERVVAALVAAVEDGHYTEPDAIDAAAAHAIGIAFSASESSDYG